MEITPQVVALIGSVVGGVLILLREVAGILGAMARRKLNGKVEDPGLADVAHQLSLTALAVSRLCDKVDGYTQEDRDAHRRIDVSLARIETRLARREER